MPYHLSRSKVAGPSFPADKSMFLLLIKAAIKAQVKPQLKPVLCCLKPKLFVALNPCATFVYSIIKVFVAERHLFGVGYYKALAGPISSNCSVKYVRTSGFLCEYSTLSPCWLFEIVHPQFC